jgi:hypothetical protein
MRKPLILVKHSLPEIVENLSGREWKPSGWSLWNKFGLPSFIAIDVESNTLVTRENFT